VFDSDSVVLVVNTTVPGFSFFGVTSVLPPNCFNSILYYTMLKVSYDAEAGKFLLFSLYDGYLCVAVSQSSDPTGAWYSYAFVNATNFQFTHGFDVKVWGDVYLVCWNNDADQNCVIMDRLGILAVDPSPSYVFMQNFITYAPGYGASPIEPLGQGTSVRGPLINSTAPCGVFTMLDEASLTVKVVTCSQLNFSSPTAPVVLTTYSLPVLGGWDSGYNLPCQVYNGGAGCIEITAGGFVIPLSNYVRTSYYAYGAYEQYALTFTTNIGTPGGPSVLWAVVNVSSVLSNTPLDMSVQVASFASNIALTCRETTILTFFGTTGGSPPVGAYLYNTFKLKTDTSMRSMPFPNTAGGLYSDSGKQNWGLPDIFVGNLPFPRGWTAMGVSSQTPFRRVTSYDTYRPANQSTSVVWTAVDACGAVSQCTQQVYMGTVTSCENTIET
jgi:hypothetical protein